MSQVTDFVTPGTPLTMAGLKAHLDACYAAAVDGNRGSSAPSNPLEGMLWLDSSGGPTAEVLRRYTVAAGWVPIMTFNITAGTITQLYGILDEDTMASDSALLPPSQQSVKAYAMPKTTGQYGTHLTMNSGATAPEWAPLAMTVVSQNFDTVYLAATDGIVMAYCNNSGAANPNISGYSSASNPPTDRLLIAAQGHFDGGAIVNITMIVRKGEYYRVTGTDGINPTMYFCGLR